MQGLGFNFSVERKRGIAYAITVQRVKDEAAFLISGKNLVTLRRSRLWSRNDLARESEMAASALQTIEQKGVASVRPKTLRKLAKAFGMEPLALVDALGAARKLLSVRADAYPGLEARAKEAGLFSVEEWLNTIGAQHHRNATVLPVPGNAGAHVHAPRRKPVRQRGRKPQTKSG